MAVANVAFWNRYWMGGARRQVDWLSRQPWDVLLLAEVTPAAWRDFSKLGSGVAALGLLGPIEDRKRPHGVAILARNDWHIEDCRLLPRLDGAPSIRRERALTAGLEHRSGAHFTALAWHAPYAAGRNKAERERNRLSKQRAYQGLWAWAETTQAPAVVGMDGNNWCDWAAPPPNPSPVADDAWKEENLFHGPNPRHGLVDTLRAVGHSNAAGDVLAITHVIPSQVARMDRIYVSPTPAINVLDAGVTYTEGVDPHTVGPGGKLSPGSDHAYVWSRLVIGGGEDGVWDDEDLVGAGDADTARVDSVP